MINVKEVMDLSNEELVALAKENPDDKRYAHALFHKNRGILTKIAFNLYGKYSMSKTNYNGYIYTEDDYLDIGYDVILIAISNFNAEKGFKFVTYLSQLYENYVKRKMFRTTYNNMPKDMVFYTLSLNSKVKEVNCKVSGDDTEIMELIPDEYALEKDYDDKDFFESTLELMKKVCYQHKTNGDYYDNCERDYDILYRRIIKGETLESIGKDYGITRERVRQIFSHKVRRLRKEMIKNGSVCR